MALISEKVILGHNNRIDLILKEDGSAISTATLTKITLSFDDTLISSENGGSDVVRWSQAGYASGEIRISLGESALDAGKYEVPMIVYSLDNTLGVQWGDPMIITIESDPEAS